ncbi:MAG: hypothetical protein IT350_06535 [Deltaproteobacteria bacterium]|nr:hypothetical protein [Deltaproteobacteria bacterium]
MGSVIKSREQLFDVRMIERNRVKGLVSDADYKAWQKSLKDAGDNAEYLSAEVFFEEAAEADYDEDDED